MHPRTTLGAPPPLHAALFHHPHEHERHHGRADASLVAVMATAMVVKVEEVVAVVAVGGRERMEGGRPGGKLMILISPS